MNTIKQTRDAIFSYLKTAITNAINDANLKPVTRFDYRYFDPTSAQPGKCEFLLTLMQGDTETESLSTRRMDLAFTLIGSCPGDPVEYIDVIRPILYGNLSANCVVCKFESFDCAMSENRTDNSLLKIEFSIIN